MNSMAGNNKKNYLVETALLGHGLISVKSDDIISQWPKGAVLAWIEGGQPKIGNIEEFLLAKESINNWKRFDGLKLKEKFNKNTNAYLTASGTMVIAKKTGYPVVVTAGIGGIGDIKAERLCYDLPALSQLGITLVATSPKDMLDIPATLSWLKDNGVKIFGVNTKYCNGYIMKLDDYKLSVNLSYEDLNKMPYGCNLILNPIKEEKRLKNKYFLDEAIKSGKKAELEGTHYHPVANACFDRLSLGLSSKIQFDALISNIEIAELITNRKLKFND
ncbi:pseudouridine-5'-phosphate glycosidase [Maledivibacter halophilus]|uniref:Pseudouridine-5'-phosphate glycosidase (PseudoU degradation) n=1 Tax=Maledivibacter halophilus TaxID=36842 RepID=A0A1T5MP47_9FIRM|nr:pseudouridine-5'-phosphate glycosidase [Maledivibacter halophilus]SKC89794.1 Pseudouridine-5'-phosphate glycosidase (pseudoU degradation) [Maledivibacter halophilus]